MAFSSLGSFCGVHKMAHVPREKMIVTPGNTWLDFFQEDTLEHVGRIRLQLPQLPRHETENDCVTGTMGGFTHARLSNYVVVGRHVGGFSVVDVRSQVVVRRVALPLLPAHAYPACHNLDHLTLAPSGLRFAVVRHRPLHVVDISVNDGSAAFFDSSSIS